MQYFQAKKLFFKYDDVIATSQVVVQVWEVDISWFGKNMPSETIISSQTFLGIKSQDIWNRDPSIVESAICGVKLWLESCSKNSHAPLFLLCLIRFTLKSPIRIIFLFSFLIFFRTSVRYSWLNLETFIDGCLKTIPVIWFAYLVLKLQWRPILVA